MTVQPIFQRDGNEWRLAGSALQIGPQLLLTCDHVLRYEKHRRDSPLRAARDLAVGPQQQEVSRVPAAGSGDVDLALVELRDPAHYSTPAFSRQWTLERVFGYGFSGPPFDRAQKDGPLPVEQRGSAIHIPIAHGMPEGFSGGPAIGMFRGDPYCIGLNQMGGIGRAATVLIPASRCVEFVSANYPGVCHLVDLNIRDLELFLVEQDATLLEKYSRSQRRMVAMVENGRASNTPTPLIDIASINLEALRQIARGALTPRIAVAADAWALSQVLRNEVRHSDTGETLVRFLRQHGFGRLQYADALSACLRKGNCAVFLLGYDHSVLGDGYQLVRTFMYRMAEQQLLTERTHHA